MMRLMRSFAAVLLIALVPACSNTGLSSNAAEAKELIPLSIKTAKKDIKFRVEIARTPDEQARGLMFRESLPADGGMIFPMIPSREASFWMKNTLIPLDMIFIREDGTIARIAAETTPQSLESVSSGEPVGAVFEIAGGKAAALGIAEGDKVSWRDPKG